MADKKRILILTLVYVVILLYFSTRCTISLVEKASITSFKKLYSLYSQALSATVYEMDGETGCFFSSNKNFDSDFSKCDKFYKKFATNLRVRKYCKNNALKNGCVPVYKSYAVIPSCAGFSESMFNRYNQVFVMDDNSNIVVFNQPQNVPKPMFAVDSNGKLFPNKSGHDLFSFVIMRSKSGNYYFHSNITYCLPKEKGGIHMLQDIYK